MHQRNFVRVGSRRPNPEDESLKNQFKTISVANPGSLDNQAQESLEQSAEKIKIELQDEVKTSEQHLPNKTQAMQDEEAIKALVSSPEALKIIFNEKKNPKADQSIVSQAKLEEQLPVTKELRSRKSSIKNSKRQSMRKKASLFRSQFLPTKRDSAQVSSIMIQQGGNLEESQVLAADEGNSTKEQHESNLAGTKESSNAENQIKGGAKGSRNSKIISITPNTTQTSAFAGYSKHPKEKIVSLTASVVPEKSKTETNGFRMRKSKFAISQMY